MMVLLSEMLGRAKLEKMLRSGEVEIVPLGVMRGRTFHDSFVVLDEAQNATFGQLKMALSRLGQNSKMVVNGDVEQCDLRRESPLKEVWRLLSGPGAHPNIGFAKMGTAEQLRPEIVNFITERLSGR
jgi:phosphate starvation-inducible PhoH-like protein